MESDAELLRVYLDSRSEENFAALVKRHLPLVYGAALRRVDGDVHRAQDIAQMVFATLSRKAPSLRSHPTLVGWLFKTTHQIAVSTMRTEFRRRRREKIAQALSDEGDASWERLRPVIDDALLDLPERDRNVILLRYFRNETYPEIGGRLGLTESGARMRAEHALEMLRRALGRRGITSTAAALGGVIVANGSVVAPAAALSAIVGNITAVAAGSGLLLFMSTATLKTGVISAVMIAGATGLFVQNHSNRELRSDLAALRTELAESGRLSLQQRRDAIAQSLADQGEIERLQAEVSRLSADQPESLQGSELAGWATRVENLRRRMAEQPEQSIPEMRFLTEKDWLEAAMEGLNTETDYRQALARLRNTAEMIFVRDYLEPAVRRYLEDRSDQFPEHISLLQGYFSEPIEPAILDRWAVMPSSEVRVSGMDGNAVVSQKSPVDEIYDQRRFVGLHAKGTAVWPGARYSVPDLTAPYEAYQAANGGRISRDPEELMAYATTPEQRMWLQRVLDERNGARWKATESR